MSKISKIVSIFVLALVIGMVTKTVIAQSYSSINLTSAANQSLTVKATPVSFTDGKWTYKVEWERKKQANGSLYISLRSNRTIKQLEISPASPKGSKTVELSPSTNYRLEFYPLPNAEGEEELPILLRKFFTTLDVPGDTNDSETELGADTQDSTGATGSSQSTLFTDPNYQSTSGDQGAMSALFSFFRALFSSLVGGQNTQPTNQVVTVTTAGSGPATAQVDANVLGSALTTAQAALNTSGSNTQNSVAVTQVGTSGTSTSTTTEITLSRDSAGTLNWAKPCYENGFSIAYCYKYRDCELKGLSISQCNKLPENLTPSERYCLDYPEACKPQDPHTPYIGYECDNGTAAKYTVYEYKNAASYMALPLVRGSWCQYVNMTSGPGWSSKKVLKLDSRYFCPDMKAPPLAINIPYKQNETYVYMEPVNITWSPNQFEGSVERVDIYLAPYFGSASTGDTSDHSWQENYINNEAEDLSKAKCHQTSVCGVTASPWGPNQACTRDGKEYLNDATPFNNVFYKIRVGYNLPNTGSYEWQAGTAYGGMALNAITVMGFPSAGSRYKLYIVPSGHMVDDTNHPNYETLPEEDVTYLNRNAIASKGFYVSNADIGSNSLDAGIRRTTNDPAFGSISNVRVTDVNGVSTGSNQIYPDRNYLIKWQTYNISKVQLFYCENLPSGVMTGSVSRGPCFPISNVLDGNLGSYNWYVDPGSDYIGYASKSTKMYNYVIVSSADPVRTMYPGDTPVTNLSGAYESTQVTLMAGLRGLAYGGVPGSNSIQVNSSLSHPFVNEGKQFLMKWANNSGYDQVDVRVQPVDTANACGSQTGIERVDSQTVRITILPCMAAVLSPDTTSNTRSWAQYRYYFDFKNSGTGEVKTLTEDIVVVPRSENYNCKMGSAITLFCSAYAGSTDQYGGVHTTGGPFHDYCQLNFEETTPKGKTERFEMMYNNATCSAEALKNVPPITWSITDIFTPLVNLFSSPDALPQPKGGVCLSETGNRITFGWDQLSGTFDKLVFRVSKNENDVRTGCGSGSSCVVSMDDVSKTQMQYTITNLEPNTTYYARLAAVKNYRQTNQEYKEMVWTCKTGQ